MKSATLTRLRERHAAILTFPSALPQNVSWGKACQDANRSLEELRELARSTQIRKSISCAIAYLKRANDLWVG